MATKEIKTRPWKWDISVKNQDMTAAFDIYYRKSDPDGPRKDLMEYAHLAIDHFNKNINEKAQHYNVVDIIRSEGYVCAGYSYFIEFTAKQRNQDDSSPTMFRAELWVKIGGEIHVVYTRTITEQEAESEWISSPY